jgi:hypothetical protein
MELHIDPGPRHCYVSQSQIAEHQTEELSSPKPAVDRRSGVNIERFVRYCPTRPYDF